MNKLNPGIRLSAQVWKDRIWRCDNSKQALVQRNLGFGPFLRYNVLAKDMKINIFCDGSVLYNINSNNGTDALSKSLSSTLVAGAVFFLNQSVGLEGLLSYNHYADVNADSKYGNNCLQFGIGLQIHLKKDG